MLKSALKKSYFSLEYVKKTANLFEIKCQAGIISDINYFVKAQCVMT